MATPEETQTPEPKLSQKEKREVSQLTRATAVIIHEVIRHEGEVELRRTASALAFSALAAGLSMGFSLVGEGLLASMLPNAPWRPLIAKLGYTLGFLFVILGRQQLFTENTITAVLPLLHNKDLITFRKLLRLWSIVFAGNMIGALAVSFVLARTSVFAAAAKNEFARMGTHAVENPFGTEFIKAIFAAWLIAFMVWMLPSAENSRIAIIVITTYIVGLGDLAHIIAGAVEVFYAVFAGSVTWLQCFDKFLIPTLIGNIIGGVTLVSALNHAQVDPDLKEKG